MHESMAADMAIDGLSPEARSAGPVPDAARQLFADALVAGTEETRTRSRRRQDILSAAFAVFAEQGYVGASMDAVAKQAAISRQTLYTYYDRKLTLALALLDSVSIAGDRQLLMLGSMETIHAEAVAKWLCERIDLICGMSDLVSLFTQVSAIEAEVLARLRQRRCNVIRMLGRSLPAFAIAAEQLETSGPFAVEALLIIGQIEDFCAQVAMGWTIDLTIASSILAANLVGFLNDRGDAVTRSALRRARRAGNRRNPSLTRRR